MSHASLSLLTHGSAVHCRFSEQVPFEGLSQLRKGGNKAAVKMLTGGVSCPLEKIEFAKSKETVKAQNALFANFVIDVGGYGVLGFVVASNLWRGKALWLSYGLGVGVIGIADLAFLFSMVTRGVIKRDAATLGGPVIWALACVITPFGLPPLQ